MNLPKNLINKISQDYDLGEVKTIKLIKGGNISHNFIFTADKGKFIVRILGYELKHYWKDKKELEFIVLDHLIKKGFPYDIPHFIKNKQGELISHYNKKLVEVYPRIKGHKLIRFRASHIKEIAKAQAIYHKTISSLKVPSKFKKQDDYKWITSQLEEMSKIKPATKLDRLMLRDVGKYLEVLKRDKNFRKGLVVGHHDFHKSNILFNGGKLTGIIDFENIAYAPKVKDFFFVPGNLKYNLIFLKEYARHNSLSKEEINNLVTQKLLANCHSFRWAYRGNMKNEAIRGRHIKNMTHKYNEYIKLERKLHSIYKIL